MKKNSISALELSNIMTQSKQNLRKIIPVLNTGLGADQWRAMGTEYSHSIYALKELIENSLSASGDDVTDIIIKIVEINNTQFRVSIEDASGGTDDINLLLTISSDSKKKKGKYSVYGHGLKHAIAFFEPNYENTEWTIQSRTEKNMQNFEMIEINAPYLYPHEKNDKYGHDGINACYKSDEYYSGEFKTPGTYISFVTDKEKLAKLNPFRKGGRPNEKLDSIVKELSNMISLFYMPLLRESKLKVKIKYGESEENLKQEIVKCLTFPHLSYLGTPQKNKNLKVGDGTQNINIEYLELDRSTSHPLVYAQCNGLVCYVNGVLIEGFTWDEEFFGGNVNHPSMNSVLCLVEVYADKQYSPELSVSKTKFLANGYYWGKLKNYIIDLCPTDELKWFRTSNNTTDEFEMRNRRYEMLVDTISDNTEFIKKEERCKIDNNILESKLRYDIIYLKKNGNLHIEEFKKETVRPQDVAQIINYANIVEDEYPDKNIFLTLASLECTESAKTLIQMYSQRKGYNIEFKTFGQLHLRN